MSITNLLGTIVDSDGVVISGTLTVNLAAPIVDLSTSPATIYSTKPSVFTITNGVVNVNLKESASVNTSYHFTFKDGSGNVWLDFDSTVPDGLGNPVQFSSLLPTGFTSDTLSSGAVRIASLLTSDSRFSPIVQPVYSGKYVLSTLSATTSYYLPKPFAGGIQIRQLSVFALSGYSSAWTFDAGFVKNDGTDSIITQPTPTVTTANGRSLITQVYNSSAPSNYLGFFIKLTAGSGATPLNGGMVVTYSQV